MARWCLEIPHSRPCLRFFDVARAFFARFGARASIISAFEHTEWNPSTLLLSPNFVKIKDAVEPGCLAVGAPSGEFRGLGHDRRIPATGDGCRTQGGTLERRCFRRQPHRVKSGFAVAARPGGAAGGRCQHISMNDAYKAGHRPGALFAARLLPMAKRSLTTCVIVHRIRRRPTICW